MAKKSSNSTGRCNCAACQYFDKPGLLVAKLRLSTSGNRIKLTYTQLPGLGQAVLKMEDKPPPNFDIDCDEYIVARIGQALRRQKQTHTWIAISEKILEVNGGEGNATIDRRTLSALCRADKFDTVKLSIACTLRGRRARRPARRRSRSSPPRGTSRRPARPSR